MRDLFRIAVIMATMAMVVVIMAPVAQAQDYTNPYTGNTFNNPASSFIDTILLHNMQTQQLLTSQMIARNSLRMALEKDGKGRKLSPSERAVADRFAKYRGTMFTPSKQPIMPARLATSIVKEPAKQQQLTALLTKLLDIYNQRSHEQNAPPNDLARTLAYCIAVNYSHYSGKDISMDSLGALRGKIRAALSSDPKFRALSNVKKQQMSETLIILTNFMDLGHTVAIQKKNQAAIESYHKMAGSLLKAMLNVEPNRVAFAKTGLVIQ